MIPLRAVLLALLLAVLVFLALRTPGVWLYDVIAHRLRGRQAGQEAGDPRRQGQAVARRANQARQSG
ncbi:MAG: hypothetical protein E2602_05125 [Achromobacter sp.]|nr:hypothetical protein [Achromobacter sp.]